MTDIEQGLLDCGCDSGQCSVFEMLQTTGERMKFLKRRRKEVCEDLHRAQRQLDCVDYLIREVDQNWRNSLSGGRLI